MKTPTPTDTHRKDMIVKETIDKIKALIGNASNTPTHTIQAPPLISLVDFVEFRPPHLRPPLYCQLKKLSDAAERDAQQSAAKLKKQLRGSSKAASSTRTKAARDLCHEAEALQPPEQSDDELDNNTVTTSGEWKGAFGLSTEDICPSSSW